MPPISLAKHCWLALWGFRCGITAVVPVLVCLSRFLRLCLVSVSVTAQCASRLPCSVHKETFCELCMPLRSKYSCLCACVPTMALYVCPCAPVTISVCRSARQSRSLPNIYAHCAFLMSFMASSMSVCLAWTLCLWLCAFNRNIPCLCLCAWHGLCVSACDTPFMILYQLGWVERSRSKFKMSENYFSVLDITIMAA